MIRSRLTGLNFRLVPKTAEPLPSLTKEEAWKILAEILKSHPAILKSIVGYELISLEASEDVAKIINDLKDGKSSIIEVKLAGEP